MTSIDQDDEIPDDSYDAFEAFNRSAGIGVVENPYPIFAMVRAEHTIKKEDLGEALIPEGVDANEVSLLGSDLGGGTDHIDLDINVFTAFGFDAVQQVLKDGETFS